MTQGKRAELSEVQKNDVWRRWKAGQSLHMIGRACGKPHTSIHCLLSHHGGIVPAVRPREGWLVGHRFEGSPKVWSELRRQ